jgi:branched-chain amino acid transport system permease protein
LAQSPREDEGVLTKLIVDGVLLGAVLCMASLGLSLSYAVFRFPNFAHGEFVTVGAYAALAGADLAGQSQRPELALPAAMVAAILAAAAVALAADRLVLRRLLARRQGAAVIIAAFAIGLLVRNVLVLLAGPAEQDAGLPLEIATPILPGVAALSAARLTVVERAVVIAAVLLMLVLQLLLRRSRFGRDLRAVAENPDLAGACGLVVPRLRAVAWGLTGMFCGLAGLALVLLGPVRPESGGELLLPALAAVIVGGLGSIGGTFAGAMLIGLAESATVHLGFAEWRQVVSFLAILLVLGVRPQGLFGRAA